MSTLAWICLLVIAVCLTCMLTERYTVWKMFKLLDHMSPDMDNEVEKDA